MSRFVLTFLLLAVADASAQTNLNAADLYRPVMSNIVTWTERNSDALGSNATDQARSAAYKELLPELQVLKQAQTATGVDWDTHFEDGIATLLPHVGPALKTEKAAIWAAGFAFSNHLAEAGEWATEGIRVARNVGENGTMLELLVQIAGEKKLLEQLRANADRMTAKERSALLGQLQAMPAGGDAISSMQMERALCVDSLLRKVLQAVREADTNLFEPVLEATGTISGAGTDVPGTNNPPAGSHATWFARDLRLASIVDSGSGWKIGFEKPDGDQFIVALGRPNRGIELLMVDYARDEALIACQGQTALVRLRERDIAPVRLRLKLPTAEELKARRDGKAGPLPEPARSVHLILEAFASSGDGNVGADDILRATGGTGEGLIALLKRTSDEYGEWIEAARARPPEAFATWQKTFLEKATPLTRLMLPAVDKVLVKERELIEARRLLIEALKPGNGM